MEKKGNLALCAGFFAISGFYAFLLKSLSAKDALYPKFVATLLFGLTIALTLQIVMSKGDEFKVKIFGKLYKQQFFTVIAVGIGYLFLINLLGYFTSTFLFLAILLVLLKVKRKMAILVAIGFCIFIYIVFRMFLGVPVPEGLIF